MSRKVKNTYEVNLYPQHGSLLETFITTAEDEEEALEIVVAELVNNEESRFFIDVGQIAYLAKMFGQDRDEYAEESGLLYVDATMYGADRPVYIDGLNLKIYELEERVGNIYQSYVIIDGSGTNLGNYTDFEDAKQDAIELAESNRFGTYEIYGLDEDNFYDDDTLVFTTDDLE